MSTKSMAYDHPAYQDVKQVPGEIAAAVSSKSARWAAFTSLVLKSLTVTVVTAGGTANTIDLIRQASGGTALTTMCSVSNAIGTAVGGVTTNVLMTHASAGSIAQGDVFYAVKGSADGTGVYAVAVEYSITPGASVTVA